MDLPSYVLRCMLPISIGPQCEFRRSRRSCYGKLDHGPEAYDPALHGPPSGMLTLLAFPFPVRGSPPPPLRSSLSLHRRRSVMPSKIKAAENTGYLSIVLSNAKDSIWDKYWSLYIFYP